MTPSQSKMRASRGNVGEEFYVFRVEDKMLQANYVQTLAKEKVGDFREAWIGRAVSNISFNPPSFNLHRGGLGDSISVKEMMANTPYQGLGGLVTTSSSNLIEQTRENLHATTLLSAPFPKTIILGFSKGGTVVNQLVTEYAKLISSPRSFDRKQVHMYPISKEDLLLSISEFHYVDVGLNCAGAYLTDLSAIKEIARCLLLNNASLRFVLHGTPRQWSDHHRPWINREKDTLLQMLKDEIHRCEGKLQVEERFYFVNMKPSLQMHFEIIQVMNIT
ncbi:uncharacterized protein LOC141836047 [Curcuma longa]|uniref:uncharacterized protein LOC141836047 n=1 Tax=Curcuma longa TaxID=136217 RepID=UPI003D9EAA1C